MNLLWNDMIMSDPHHSDLSHDREPDHDTALNRGLAAGFGAERTMPGDGPVLTVLRSQLGVDTHIELAAPEREDAPIVDAHSPELAHFRRHGGRYQVLGEIARGGMGAVFSSRDIDLGRDVAMKVLQMRHARNTTMVQRFIEEAQITGQLQHPGVLPVYELGLGQDQRPFFTMKLVRGKTLAALLDDRPDPARDRPRFLRIFEQVCQTVAYAHARGVIHRDLKPSNVMVGAFGEVQILDWGLAKVLARGDSADARENRKRTAIETVRTREDSSDSIAGSVMGTPAYMAPEQSRGEVDRIDERADVFALGGILCEMLTGRPPDNPQSGPHPMLQSCGADRELIALAQSCLNADRNQRPRHAGVVAEEVSRYMTALDQRAKDAEIAAAEAKARAGYERRTRRMTILLGLIALVVGTAGVWGYASFTAQRDARSAAVVNEAINEAGILLGRALDAPVGQTAIWDQLLVVRERFANTLERQEVDRGLEQRARTLLARLDEAQRDRRLVETIEDAVIIGATHMDKSSWNRMAGQLRAAFLEFGVDVSRPPDGAVTARIFASDSAVQLAEGIELWIGTEGMLGYFGVHEFTIEQLQGWEQVLYDADPDPFRSAQRRVYYDVMHEYHALGRPNPARADDHARELKRLAETVDFDAATPRSLSWLATTMILLNESELCLDVYDRAVIAHPQDFMLAMDYARLLASPAMQKWQESIRMYQRCIAIRPEVGGLWRNMAQAYRELDELENSLDAFNESIRIQPDHSPTYVDRGVTFEHLDRRDDAMADYRRAIVMQPDDAEAHCRLGRVLQATGALHEALRELKRGHELGSATPGWRLPSAAWIEECEKLIYELGEDSSVQPKRS